MKNSQKSGTLIGFGALALWAIEPLVVIELEGLPLFQALTLVFLSCFALTAVRVTLAKKWSIIFRQPIFAWCFGILAICGSDFSYMLGAFSAPIAHVDLIDYLWPSLLVVVMGFLPNEKFSFKYLVGALLGLLGVGCLISHGDGLCGFNPDYVPGYLLATIGVMLWGAYSTYSKLKIEMPSDMVGIYCGIGALITCVLHYQLETTVMPTMEQTGLAILLGLAGPGLAYQLWDYGMKYGNARWLSVCCYLVRVIAMTLLVIFDKEPMSQQLVVACSLALLGMLICSCDFSRLKAWLQTRYMKITTENHHPMADTP